MKKGLVTYGGYVLAACLLVAMAVSQQSSQRQTAGNPLKDKPAFRLMALKAKMAEIAQGVKDGELDPSEIDHLALGEEYGSADGIYSDIAASRDSLSDFVSMDFALDASVAAFIEDQDALTAHRAGQILDLQRIELEQNQRIIELLEGMSEN